MSTNQWPDLKKEMEKIPVPTEKLDAIIANTIQQEQPRRSKKKVLFYATSAAVLGLGLFIGSASVSPAMAKIASNIPLIGTFFNDSLDEGLRIAGQEGLTQVVNQSAKDNGITLTMNEFFYDGTRLTFGYTQESLFAIGELERPTIKVNGQEINFSSGYSGDFVTPQKYKGTIDITPTEELPEAFDMTMTIDAVGLIPGKWEFNFPVKQSNEVTVIEPQETKLIEGAQVEISTLKLGPAGTDLQVKVLKDVGNTRLDPYFLQFDVLDDHGKMLDTLTGNGHGETVNGKEIIQLNFLYSPLKEESKELRIIPYTIPVSTEGWKEVTVPVDEQQVPFIVDQGEFGDILVTDIDYQPDKIIVYFDLQSDVIVDDKLSRYSFRLEDANGKDLFLADQPFAERIEGNTFKQEFAAGSKKGLQIKTYQFSKPITYEEFIIDISQ
jgi:hypothetical protein